MDATRLNQELNNFDAQVDAFERNYDTQADGKNGLQKGMDVVRSWVNRGNDGNGHGDDQFKNIANTQYAIEQIKAGLQSGSLNTQQAEHQLDQLRQSFAGEAQRVDQAQQSNARMGQVVHGAGRMVAVGAAGVAGTVAGGGVNVATGVAAAVAAGSAYDALTVGAGQIDTKMGNGGSSIAPELNTQQSLGGLGANALAGQKMDGKDVVRAATGTALDAVSGFGAGQSIAATRTAVAATHGSLQAAQAAAGASVKTGLQQSAATLAVQNTGTALDPSLSAEQKRDQIAAQTQDMVKQAPTQIAFGALSSALGMTVQPSGKLQDAAAQLVMDGLTNVGETSLNNVWAGQSPALTSEQWAQAGILSGSGALHNIAQRNPPADARMPLGGQAMTPERAQQIVDAQQQRNQQAARALAAGRSIEMSAQPFDPQNMPTAFDESGRLKDPYEFVDTLSPMLNAVESDYGNCGDIASRVGEILNSRGELSNLERIDGNRVEGSGGQPISAASATAREIQQPGMLDQKLEAMREMMQGGDSFEMVIFDAGPDSIFAGATDHQFNITLNNKKEVIGLDIQQRYVIEEAELKSTLQQVRGAFEVYPSHKSAADS
jgi:hypothetical protein